MASHINNSHALWYALFAIIILLLLPFIVIFLLFAVVCFVIAIPSLIIFGLIYLFYTRLAKDRKWLKVIFLVVVIILSPLLLVLLILLAPFAICFAIICTVKEHFDPDQDKSKNKSTFDPSKISATSVVNV